MSRFEDYAFEFVSAALREAGLARLDDVYAVSLWAHHQEDDPRNAMIRVGFNTERPR